MDIREAKKYLENNGQVLLAGGASGAKVYDIAGKYVLKCVRREEIGNDGIYAAYRKEALWYECARSTKDATRLTFLPEILDICGTDDETAVLMKKYRVPGREELNTGLLKKIMETLAAVHTTPIPHFLMPGQEQQAGMHGMGEENHPEDKKADLLSEEQIKEYLSGWLDVLDEHPGVFSAAPLRELSGKINRIIEWHAQEEAVLNHGDFHWDNLLMDGQGNILICDWQGICAGAASGDISFFFSRLGADGIHPDTGQAIRFYVQEVKRLSGKNLVPEEICRHMAAADVITSFAFWHEYLHGSDVKRVRGIYQKMVDDSRDF